MNKRRRPVWWGDGNGHGGDFGWWGKAGHPRAKDHGRCAPRRSARGLRDECRATDFAQTLAWLRALAQRLRERALPQWLLGKACDYLLGHWEPLTAHVQHGQTKLDNNLIENAIRPSAIGKKNWLFIGHPDAGQRSAVIYSIVVSCQRHGKDPLACLRDVFTRLPAMTNHDDLAPLLPANWQPA
jgi:transposase